MDLGSTIAKQQRRRMNVQAGHTTLLVHDVYFRLSKPEAFDVYDRAHFYAVAGKAMRHLLIDQLREQQSTKHGEGQIELLDTLDIDIAAAPEWSLERSNLQALEQAVTQLGEIGPDLERLAELRFYVGLTLPELVEITERSARSLKRDWRKVRAFFFAC